MKNKTLYLLIAAMLTLSMVLVACGSDDASEPAATEVPDVEEPADVEEPVDAEESADTEMSAMDGATVVNPMDITTEYLNVSFVQLSAKS